MATIYSLEPMDKAPGKVLLKHTEFPEDELELQMWEHLYHLNWSQNGYFRISGPEEPWQKNGDDILHRKIQTVDGIKAKIELKPTEECVFVTLTVSNITRQVRHEFWGVYDFLDFWADLCLHYRNAPTFCDLKFERTCISVNGNITTLKDTDLSTTYKECLPAYQVRGQEPRRKALPEGNYSYGSGFSATKADESWIAVTSTNGEHTLLTGFPQVHHLWANHRPCVHGCIHANAMLGDIAVDKTVSTTGVVMIIPGSAADAAGKFKELMRNTND